MRININLLCHVIFWASYFTAFWGAFEQACKAGAHPIWSGTWGYPIPHHYVIGFAGIMITYFFISKKDWIRFIEKLGFILHTN